MTNKHMLGLLASVRATMVSIDRGPGGMNGWLPELDEVIAELENTTRRKKKAKQT